MKEKILNTVKGVSGYLLFVLVITLFINSGSNYEETDNQPTQLITLTEYILNCFFFASTLGLVGLIMIFSEERKYSFKLTLLYFFFLLIFSVYTSSPPNGITSLDLITTELISNSFTHFFLFSFISFFVLLRTFSRK